MSIYEVEETGKEQMNKDDASKQEKEKQEFLLQLGS